jgi:hypothetical protein
MDNSGQKPGSQPCGPECACNSSKKGMSTRTKTICMGIIIIVAGVVLGNSLIRKSRSAVPAPKPGYSSALSIKTSSSGTQQSPATETKPAMENISLAPLASLASLDTVAREVDGVFILLVNSDAEKTQVIQQEISAAANAITSRGTRTGIFRLAKTAPDFTALTTQMPAPCVLVIVKGRGMRGVPGNEITQTKLLQAWFAAMQPSACCPAGSKRVCK